jgi:hypothetical protein
MAIHDSKPGWSLQFRDFTFSGRRRLGVSVPWLDLCPGLIIVSKLLLKRLRPQSKDAN